MYQDSEEQDSESGELAKQEGPKNLVGSVHSGTVNYLRDAIVFDPNYMPTQSKEAAATVKAQTRPDILGLNRPN